MNPSPDDMSTLSRAPGWRPTPEKQPEFIPGRVERGRYVPPDTTPRGGAVLGEVHIDDMFVHTPIGDMRRDQTRWQVGQTVPGPARIPTWAVLCAVFLFLCMGPFSLLFLLAKESVGETTPVHLTDGRLSYTTKVNTYDQAGYRLILQTIEWAERALPERRAIGG